MTDVTTMTMPRLFAPNTPIPAATDDLVGLLRAHARAAHAKGGPLQQPMGVYPEALLAALSRLENAEGRRAANDSDCCVISNVPVKAFGDPRLSAMEWRVLIALHILREVHGLRIEEIATTLGGLADKGYLSSPEPEPGDAA